MRRANTCKRRCFFHKRRKQLDLQEEKCQVPRGLLGQGYGLFLYIRRSILSKKCICCWVEMPWIQIPDWTLPFLALATCHACAFLKGVMQNKLKFNRASSFFLLQIPQALGLLSVSSNLFLLYSSLEYFSTNTIGAGNETKYERSEQTRTTEFTQYAFVLMVDLPRAFPTSMGMVSISGTCNFISLRSLHSPNLYLSLHWGGSHCSHLEVTQPESL